MKKIPAFYGFNLTQDDRYNYVSEHKLFRLGIKINTPNTCNWACPYCYVGDEDDEKRPVKREADGKVSNDLSKDKLWATRMKGWIDQGIELGVKAVTINGTFEPTTSKSMIEIIEYCTSANLATTLVTNGTLLNEKMARDIYNTGANIMTKINVPMVDSSDDNYMLYSSIQKKLSGLKNDAKKIYEEQKAVINMLVDIGFNKVNKDGSTRLGIESIVSNLNVEYLPLLIQEAREKNMYAHIEITKLQGFAKQNRDLTIGKDKLEELFTIVQKNDSKNGYEPYEIKPPYLAGTCYENLNRLDIHADGKVNPCPGIETTLGDLNKDKLKDIVISKPLEIIRNLEKYIEGDCKECELFINRECYGGCRGTVYQTLISNGHSEYESWVGSDPSCWRVTSLLDNNTVDHNIFNKISE